MVPNSPATPSTPLPPIPPGITPIGTVGVIGLGAMGEPIARNLVAAGWQLVLFNRSTGKAEPFRDRAVIAACAHDVFGSSEVILLVLPGAPEIDQVLQRSDGVVRAPVRDRIIVNMATVAPRYSQTLASAVAAQGGRYVEAPLSGSRKPAAAGALIVLAAAAHDDVLDRIQPLFDTIGKQTIRCGAPPEATRMKLANNLLLITMLVGLAEAFHFAQAIGLGPQRFIDLVLAGPMANDVFRGKAGKLLTADYTAEAAITNVHKDSRLINAEAQRAGASAPVAATIAELLATADTTLPEDDIIGVIHTLRSMSSLSP